MRRSGSVLLRSLAGAALVLLGGCYRSENVVPLKGVWEYRVGFEPAWLDQQTDGSSRTGYGPLDGSPKGDRQSGAAPTDGWRLAKYPLNFYKDERFYAMAGHITVRRELPADLLERARQDGGLAFRSGITADVSRYYVNGVLIGRLGTEQPYRSAAYQNIVADIPVGALHAEGPNYLEVVLHSEGDYHLALGGPSIAIGVAQDLYTMHWREELISFVLFGLYFAVGLYHLLLYVRRRHEVYNLYFGLLCVALTLYWFFRTASRDVVFSDHIWIRSTVELCTLFMLGPLMIAFFSQFFYGKFGIPVWVEGARGGLLAIAIVVSPYLRQQTILLIWQLSAPPMMIFIVAYVAWAALKHKNRDAMYLLLGILFLMLSAIHDIFAAQSIINTPHIARYAFTIFILGIAGVLANRFVRVHREVEELNQSLEHKVEVRTRELQRTLNEVRALKVQQDGDYFLTSLLIKPLGGNFAKSENVDIDILVRQKKRFHFRRWNSEIGGDLCTAHTIELRGHTYTAFLNGDAMGKSMQGAGGALVLGVVFKSVITRTAYSSISNTKSPERWLKDCFTELQNIFVSFDGSMLISAVLGLVDDKTGLVYYINAEHPWVVLYRERQASFIENELLLRKIGLEGLEGHLRVNTFQMKPDDVLIVGSDGRDDVALGMNERGVRIINEDEYQFLRRVEEGGGDLERIEQAITSVGELTDDFTLVRIGFREDRPIMFDEPPARFGELLEAGRAALRAASFELAEAKLLEARSLVPESATRVVPRCPEAQRVSARR